MILRLSRDTIYGSKEQPHLLILRCGFFIHYINAAGFHLTLANSTKMWYAYDSLGRVITRIISNTSNNSIISTESFSYDAAGNVNDAHDGCFQCDINNRLIVFNGNTVSYDMDGNMLDNGAKSFTYDSANRLITAGGHTYTYNAEGMRIRKLCTENDTTYTYDTNCKLSQLLVNQFKHTLGEHIDKHKTKWAEATSNIYNSVKQMWESLF